VTVPPVATTVPTPVTAEESGDDPSAFAAATTTSYVAFSESPVTTIRVSAVVVGYVTYEPLPEGVRVRTTYVVAPVAASHVTSIAPFPASPDERRAPAGTAEVTVGVDGAGIVAGVVSALAAATAEGKETVEMPAPAMPARSARLPTSGARSSLPRDGS